MERPPVRFPDRCPAHRGELLREVIIPATGRSKGEIASLLGISRQHLYDILRERKPVTTTVAIRLGKLFGDGPGIWVRMQAGHDTWHAAREVDTRRIPTLDAAWALLLHPMRSRLGAVSKRVSTLQKMGALGVVSGRMPTHKEALSAGSWTHCLFRGSN